jgi:hypothetical protein
VSTYAELRSTEAFKHGWVPADYPANTVHIQEWHDLDTNRIWIRATYQGDTVAFGREAVHSARDGVYTSMLTAFSIRDHAELSYYRLSPGEVPGDLPESVIVDGPSRSVYYYMGR